MKILLLWKGDQCQWGRFNSLMADLPKWTQIWLVIALFVCACVFRRHRGAGEADLQSGRRVLLRVLSQQSWQIHSLHHLGGSAHPEEVSCILRVCVCVCERASNNYLSTLPHLIWMVGSAGKWGLQVWASCSLCHLSVEQIEIVLFFVLILVFGA